MQRGEPNLRLTSLARGLQSFLPPFQRPNNLALPIRLLNNGEHIVSLPHPRFRNGFGSILVLLHDDAVGVSKLTCPEFLFAKLVKSFTIYLAVSPQSGFTQFDEEVRGIVGQACR